MLLWMILLGCFSETRNCGDGSLRSVFPSPDDMVPADTTRMAGLVGYGAPWTNCGMDGWDEATYTMTGTRSGVLADGATAVSWPEDLFWMSLSATPEHGETLRLHLNEADTAEPAAWTAEVDTGLVQTPQTPTSLDPGDPTVSTKREGGRDYASLLGTGTADVPLDGLLVQTLTSDTVYGPEDASTSGEVVLSSTIGSDETFVWTTSDVGLQDGATELCVRLRVIDVEETVYFEGEAVCFTL